MTTARCAEVLRDSRSASAFLLKSSAVAELTSVIELTLAGKIYLTPRTVAFHKYTMMETLGLQTGAELVQYAVERHIVVAKDSNQ